MTTLWSTGEDIDIQQLPAGLGVVLVLGHLGKVLHGLLQSPEGKDISDRVATLICGSEDGICWSWRTFRIPGTHY